MDGIQAAGVLNSNIYNINTKNTKQHYNIVYKIKCKTRFVHIHEITSHNIYSPSYIQPEIHIFTVK